MTNKEVIESLFATVNTYRRARKNIDTSVYVPRVTIIVELDKIAALDHAITMLERVEKLRTEIKNDIAFGVCRSMEATTTSRVANKYSLILSGEEF